MRSILYTALFFLVCSSISTSSFAQVEKTVVALAPFSFMQGSANKQYTSRIFNLASNAFAKNGRFDVRDRMYDEVISYELDEQKKSQYREGKVVQQGKQIGADVIVFGHVDYVGAAPSQNQDGSETYYSQVMFTLRAFDVETGLVMASEVFTQDGHAGSGNDILGSILNAVGKVSSCAGNSIDGAVNTCLLRVPVYIDEFITNNFPIEFKIYDVSPENKDMVVLLVGNEKLGVKERSKLEVFLKEKKKVGEEYLLYTRPIGEIKVGSFEGAFIKCKASKNEDDILFEFRSGNKLYVREK
jgi:curli biogenesis system outer membrane secretion channel CsgG